MCFKNDQVSEGETLRILELARECLSVPGDFVEFGCYRGDTSLMLAEMLQDDVSSCGKPVEKNVDELWESSGKAEKNGGEPAKKLWIYDSFEGLPEKSVFDESVLGEDFKRGELFVSKREVKERFLRAGLPVPRIVKGWFCDLGESDLPSLISFAFLDGDFYESIRDSLRLVGPRMSEGGVIVVHDYSNPALPGVRKAVEEGKGKLREGIRVVGM